MVETKKCKKVLCFTCAETVNRLVFLSGLLGLKVLSIFERLETNVLSLGARTAARFPEKEERNEKRMKNARNVDK